MKKDPDQWKDILLASILPTGNSLDLRDHQEKTIFEAGASLSDLVGAEVVIKIAEKSGDGLTPEMQFEAGKY